MPDESASILLASSWAIDRLCTEGGVGSSFLAVFQATSLLDTVGDGVQGGFDRLLASRPLVACDRTLIEPINDEILGAVRLRLYYANFVAKLARRRLLLLVVLEDDPTAMVAALEQCRRDITVLGDAHPNCKCEVIVVATGDLTQELHDGLNSLRNHPAVGRLYMMTQWLQAGDDTRPVALSRHVWPTCVARLLVARSVAEPARSTGKAATLLAWRTFAWGTHKAASRASAWESEYLKALSDHLIPSIDDTPDEQARDRGGAEANDDAAAQPPELGAMQWPQGADNLVTVGSVATRGDCLREITAETCRNAAKAAFNATSHRNGLFGHVKGAWGRVASEKGLAYLRRIRDGRLWKPFPLAKLIEAQRQRWREWKIASVQLEHCRVEHGKALDTLALARRRHLGLGWHFIIGAMILPFVFQFLAGILLPLRPDDPGDGSPLFSLPGKASGSVAYLVDRSSSMEGIRLERMKADLKDAIAALRDGTPFTVVAFNDGLEEMPQAAGRLIAATKGSRDAAITWVDQIAAQGYTTAVPGLRTLVGLQPDSLMFLTDGQFTDSERSEIKDMLADKAFLGKTRIDTVMLYPIGEEAALEDLARATGGRYRRAAFDPFAPLGFNRVLLITFFATAAGVAFGAWLPWLIERISGIAATWHLAKRLQTLLGDYGRFSKQTAVALAEADTLNVARNTNSSWAYQRRLAARALAQVEASLQSPSLLHEQPHAVKSGALPGDALAVEDRQDIHDALDEPLPDWRAGDYKRARLREIAEAHAKKLRSKWQHLASQQDPLRFGHLPLREIEAQFGEAVSRCLMEASLQLFLPGCHSADAARVYSKAFSELFENLSRRITDDVHRPFLSAGVKSTGGAMPPRTLTWIGMKWQTADYDLHETAQDYFRQHTQIRFVSEHSVPDVGLRALGLVHEEIEVLLSKREDGSISVLVEPDRTAESITEGIQ